MMRTHETRELSENIAGEKVSLAGWADKVREHGAVTFVDLRDRYGKVQCVVGKKSELFEKTREVTKESCLLIEGEVKERPEGAKKDSGPGSIEISIENLKVLSKSDPLPFDLDKEGVNEDTRLKYRYLDLRKPRMRSNLETRHKIIKFMRDYLDNKEFLEVQTPILTKSSPEGARDYIVPARLHPGKFYALPQAPQQYKQLLMISGIEKYFQIAPCFRDEDPRADRCPGEFYQLDLEMSFVDREDILQLVEDLFTKMVKKIFPDKKLTFNKFKRVEYKEAMEKYNSDKPDLRENKEDPNELAFAWVVDFPLFEEEKENGYFAPKHHMFTAPKEEDLDKLTTEKAHEAKSYQFDLVLNGYEIGGGSIRIHDRDVQNKIFDLIGFGEKEKKDFSHMLNAFKYGVPPHGGIAPGIDRLIMALVGEEHIRETIAFPKNREAKDVTMGAPSEIADQQLKDANIELNNKAKENLGRKKG